MRVNCIFVWHGFYKPPQQDKEAGYFSARYSDSIRLFTHWIGWILTDLSPHEREEDPATAEYGKDDKTSMDAHQQLVCNIRCDHDTTDEER